MQRPNEEERKKEKRGKTVVRKKQLGTQVYVMHVDIMPQLRRKGENKKSCLGVIF